ncbi:AraC family transcriptional regulator [Paludibacter sp. 221]|uniref:AraC family transcriptional regulator n=1 Tax=Paludibacter sp. 221 TaxID=2302939 RepID=UPI0013D644A8|nr:AraC family transcriptional regulator [Paludibacter sp. 221]NDV47031.1 AraC family transcriptional regulator [Paludibacter sp. 221]
MNPEERSRQEYISRINKVMDYIEKNIDKPIDLQTLAQTAHFSPYHFHRIFTFLTGETPNNFLLRVRIEKSAYMLRNKEHSIGDIAYRCGFNNVSTFSRTFRKFFNVTAKEFRKSEKAVYTKDNLLYSKNGQLISKNGQVISQNHPQFCSVEFNNLIIMNTKIEVKEMPEMQVIYVRHRGQFYEIYKAYEKLFRWAGPRGLADKPEAKTMTVYHDDPSVTDIMNVRQDACLVVTEDVKTEGEIGKMTVDGGKYAVGRFEIGNEEFQRAWNTMCQWFTESGYQAADANTYELYHNNHLEHPEKKHIVDICIPVKPL